MDYIRCTQKVLPIRFAFLVSLSDKDSLLTAVRYSTALWGGLGNIIVPIWKKFPNKITRRRTLGLLVDFDPDYIVNLTSLDTPKDIKELYGDRLLTKNDLINKNSDGKFKFNKGLTIMPLLSHVWNTETKSMSGTSMAILYKNLSGRFQKFGSVVFGEYPTGFALNFSDSFTSALKAKTREANIMNFAKYNLEDSISPIMFSVYQLTQYGHNLAFSSHIIYIGNPSNNMDLIEFWNIRASGCNVLFVPYKHYELYKKSILTLIKGGDYPINESVQNHADLQKAPSLKESEFNAVCDWIKNDLNHNLSRRTWMPSWGARRERVSRDLAPCKYLDNDVTTNLLFDGKNLAPLELARPSFFHDDRIYQEFKRHFQDRCYWVNEIVLSDNYENDYFFTIPNDKTLKDLVAYSFILGSRDKTRLSDDGIIYYNDSIFSSINIHPLKTKEVFDTLFKKRGMELTPSPAGIFADKIIEYMGEIDDCRAFKIRGVRDVLVRLSQQKPRFGYTYGELKGIIGDKSKDNFGGPNWDDSIYKDLNIYYKQDHPLKPEIVINHLFSKNIFRAGLRFTCNNCSKEDWYHLTEFDVNFTCRYCFMKQHVGSLDGNAKKEWHYKNDGLFMISNAGEGSLAVILSIWRLHNYTHGSNFKYLTSQLIKGDRENEVDFMAMATNHFQEGSILILGEARNFVDYTPKEINKLTAVGVKFDPKPYLCITTLKDEFSTKEKEAIKKASIKGFKLLPLTRLDLDPYDLYERFSKSTHRHGVTLSDLSENLVKLNL